MAENMRQTRLAVGVRAALKALEKDKAQKVYLALDAEGRILRPLKDALATKSIDIVEVATMAELGRICRVEVKVAAAAVLKQ